MYETNSDTQRSVRKLRIHAIAMPFATVSFIHVSIMAANVLRFSKPYSLQTRLLAAAES